MTKFQKVFFWLTIGGILSLIFSIFTFGAVGPSREDIAVTPTAVPEVTEIPSPPSTATPEATGTPTSTPVTTLTPTPSPTVIPTPTTSVIISGEGEISLTLTGDSGYAALTATIKDGGIHGSSSKSMGILFIIWILIMIF